MSAITIAASGMAAASLRLQVAARNIANAGSTGALPGATTPAGENAPQPYTPLRVDQVEVAGGGTAASVSPAGTEPVPLHDPGASYADENGMVAAPNVDLTQEMVQVMVAKYTFAANAAVLRTGAHMYKALLDITR
jgi:flagellar basal-body rod protein FlgC